MGQSDKTARAKRTPPKSHIKSVQYDLFSQFVSNDPSAVSNAIELWESIPKYFFTPEKTKNLCTDQGLANPYQYSYDYKGVECSVKIQPALLEQNDGKYRAFFPSVTEELVEEALKKIFTDQNYGIHDPQNSESWVKFSLSMIQRELSQRGRSRNRAEIKHAIDVMSGCIITLYREGKEVWKGAILQDLVTVDREEYLADPNSQHIARLPLFISYAINKLEYRQFNYDRLMQCDRQLTRWLYKQLVQRYRQASPSNSYHFMYKNLKRDSGLLEQSTDTRNRQKLILSLDELRKCKVIACYKYENKKNGRKIEDVKYTLFPSEEFISEQKAANKRHTDLSNTAKNLGLFVENS